MRGREASVAFAPQGELGLALPRGIRGIRGTKGCESTCEPTCDADSQFVRGWQGCDGQKGTDKEVHCRRGLHKG